MWLYMVLACMWDFLYPLRKLVMALFCCEVLCVWRGWGWGGGDAPCPVQMGELTQRVMRLREVVLPPHWL